LFHAPNRKLVHEFEVGRSPDPATEHRLRASLRERYRAIIFPTVQRRKPLVRPKRGKVQIANIGFDFEPLRQSATMEIEF
jgi:hypothetical protein